MYPKTVDIASLISSRICHDLASPLGAIANGLELMELSGAPSTPEFELLSESVENAVARINFFRIAFGPPEFGAQVAESDIRNTIFRYYSGQRIKIFWLVSGDIPRPQAKLAMLFLSCMETFLPFGGTITVSNTDDLWTFDAKDPRLRGNAERMALLSGQGDPTDLKPSQIQFELVRQMLSDAQIDVDQSNTDGHVSISYQYTANYVG